MADTTHHDMKSKCSEQ